MTGATPEPTPERTRWAAVRGDVRAWLGQRLRSETLAAELLPVDPHEPRAAAQRAPRPTWPSVTALAAEYPALLDPTLRKRRGAWFTPAGITEPTVDRTLGPLLPQLREAPARICDPAVGGGAFLLAALHWQRAQGIDTRRAAATLHGLDVDSTVAAIAAVALWEACGAEAPDVLQLAAQVRAGDGLQDLEPGSCDAVLTNPPWETLQASDEARRAVARLRARFTHQGSGKLYTYRLFVERCHELLRDDGRFGMVVPASLWFDRDARPLRELLLDACRWEWLFGFENRRRIFAIDSRYRFAVIVGSKGGRTPAVNAAFGRVDLDDWRRPAPPHTRYGRDLVAKLSPRSGAFVEADDDRDLDLLRRMHARSAPLVGDGGAFTWRQGDYNMTADRDRFVRREAAEADGFVRAADGNWRRGADVLLPLYQGAMVYDLHPNAAVYRSGTGRATTWEAPREHDDLRPQYLIAPATLPADTPAANPAR
ncbi:MAG: N-6 DNA methylase, partial [Planctomycetes bacterium]|nr:N-6 DNA methylase [Planctomycetota bacterium]